MDPVEVREERVATAAPAGPVLGGEPATFPVREPVTPRATAAPAAAAPLPVAPAAAAPAAGTAVVSRTRRGVYPAGWRAIQTIWLVTGVVDIILALDFIFRATGGANTGFAHYIYWIGSWLAMPFNGIFGSTSDNFGTNYLRWSDVLAFAIYTVAAWILTKAIRIAATPRAGIPAA